ncbi:MAG: Wzt carbohydrate-binding domain-containing protein [Casimicrobiaceae bacterium]
MSALTTRPSMLDTTPADPASLRILILSTPKTGNTWLRWLLHYVYALPFVELPRAWSEEIAASLPATFVTHQHLPPNRALVEWLVRNRAVVLTTIRHPGDTLVSYFHYLKWNREGIDRAEAMVPLDGDAPGSHTLALARSGFAQTYSVSLAWAALGAQVVRYEDLLASPLDQLAKITNRIAPVHQHKLATAALLCKPEQLTRPGLVDPRHLRTSASGAWQRELPDSIVDVMAKLPPYTDACSRYGYDWERTAVPVRGFDYDAIDPFQGRRTFDNGETMGAFVAAVYLRQMPDSLRRWPTPWGTEGDSFWGWLRGGVSGVAGERDTEPAGYTMLTNLMIAIYQSRPDLQGAYPDLEGEDRPGFAEWFLGQARVEFDLPWGLIAPVQEAYLEHLKTSEARAASWPRGRIAHIQVVDRNGRACEVFRCGQGISIEVAFELHESVARPVIGYSLRTEGGLVVFGTNSTLLGTPLPALDAGSYVCRVETTLSVQPQHCYVAVGLAAFDDHGAVLPIHRRYDEYRITITGDAAYGGSWCTTSIRLAG